MSLNESATDVEALLTAEMLLESLRKGNTQKLEIGFGEIKIKCRLLSAHEEALVMVKAAQQAQAYNPTGLKQELFEAQEQMRALLVEATKIGGVGSTHPKFFVDLPAPLLSDLFDQYQTLNHTINPDLATMKPEEIARIVDDIKKKKKVAKDFYTWQLAEVGKYFLEVIIPNLPTDNDAGSL